MSQEEATVTEDAQATAPNIYPCLGYRHAGAAIRWLCERSASRSGWCTPARIARWPTRS